MVRKFRIGARGVIGSGAFFISNGAVFAALLPWYPLMMERLSLSPMEFGLIVPFFAIGAIASSVLPARLIDRFRAVPVSVGGTVVLAGAVVFASWAGNGIMLAVCLFVVGFSDAIVDVAQNVIGIAIQDRSGRSILSSMHALWSLGGVAGGAASTAAASTAAASAGVDMRVALPIVGLACIGLVVFGGLLVGNGTVSPAEQSDDDSSDSDSGDRAGPSRWRLVLWVALPVAVIAICGTTVEDIANNWSSIAAVRIGELSASSAGIAFSTVIGSQCLGRFSGDFLIQRFGPAGIARLGGVLITLGGAAIIAAQGPVLLLIGLAVVGYGSATLVPSALGAAAHLPGVSKATGVTLVSWIMRLGFVLTSPVVGLMATAANLRWGLSILIVIGLVTAVLAGRLNPAAARTSVSGV